MKTQRETSIVLEVIGFEIKRTDTNHKNVIVKLSGTGPNGKLKGIAHVNFTPERYLEKDAVLPLVTWSGDGQYSPMHGNKALRTGWHKIAESFQDVPGLTAKLVRDKVQEWMTAHPKAWNDHRYTTAVLKRTDADMKVSQLKNELSRAVGAAESAAIELRNIEQEKASA